MTNETQRKLGRSDVERILGRRTVDTFHNRSFSEPILSGRVPLEEDTGWIVFHGNGRTRKAKPHEVPKRLGCGVRPEDGIPDDGSEVDEALANLIPDTIKKTTRKRGGRK